MTDNRRQKAGGDIMQATIDSLLQEFRYLGDNNASSEKQCEQSNAVDKPTAVRATITGAVVRGINSVNG